jgi:hypothetical protein
MDLRDWLHLAQDKDQWRALVNMMTDLQVPKSRKIGLSDCQLLKDYAPWS